MSEQTRVIEYKCPCCDAGLVFAGNAQRLTCEYCDNTFEIDAVRAYNESTGQDKAEPVQWEDKPKQSWSTEEQNDLHVFQCPTCGGELITDENTAASLCPYCGNPAIMANRISGGLRPDAVLPFKTSREDAKAAYLKLCQGKPLLPKFFTQEQQLEKITGIYVPFWLYDCSGELHGSYKATRTHRWSDSRYHYTKTDHFLLKRESNAVFLDIPMDGSSKMDDTFMESIEPFDCGELVDFNTAYLSGFLADKYDIPSENGEERIRQRVGGSLEDLMQSSFIGYDTVIPTSRQLSISHGRARYVLFPVWMLNTKYKDKTYTFAMNGQTGKMTGSLPICPKRTAAWFAGIFACVTALVKLVEILVL